jgi:nitrous oxidase accessory protein
MLTTNFQKLMGLLLLVGGIALLALAAKSASAATLTVDDDGNAEYTKIQDAIDNATEGDTIRVWAGTYKEHLVVDKSINLVGNGSELVTIDGSESGDVVQITADWVNMSGFTVTESGGTWENQKAGIAIQNDRNHIQISENTLLNNYNGIYFYLCKYITISHNAFINNLGGIYHGIYPGQSFIKHLRGYNMISNNICLNNSVGIYIERSYWLTLENNTCSNNNGAGIYLSGSGSNTLTNNTCNLNNGTGIVLWSSSNCTITKNTCSSNNDNGIYLNNTCSENTLTNNICSNNNGTGIKLHSSSITEWDELQDPSTYNTIANNTCCSNNENGIYLNMSDYLEFSSSNTISNNTCSNNSICGIVLIGSGSSISNNTCSNNGCGIQLSSSQFSDSNNIVSNNTCSNNSFGIILSGNNNIVSNNICNSNNEVGISIVYADNNAITYNTFSRNNGGIILGRYSQYNTAHYNNIFDNIEYGINATGNDNYTIDATLNWWGDNSGPYHPKNNTNGKGNNVTDHVEFEPWIDENGNLQNLKEDGDEDNEGFIPGFGAAAVVGAVVIYCVITPTFKKRKKED